MSGVFGLLSGIVGHLLGVFKPNVHGLSAETGSGDRLGSKSAVRVQASPPQPNSTGQARLWLRIDQRYPHNDAGKLLSLCLRADSTDYCSRHTDTATCNDICTFVKTTSWFWKLDFTNERRTSVCISLFYEL